MAICDYVISIEEHSEYIIKFVEELVQKSINENGHNLIMI